MHDTNQVLFTFVCDKIEFLWILCPLMRAADCEIRNEPEEDAVGQEDGERDVRERVWVKSHF